MAPLDRPKASVDAAVRHLALGGGERDGRDVAAQVVAGEVVEHAVVVLGGQHDDLDVAVDRLVHATQRGAQGRQAMGRHDRQADRGVRTTGGRGTAVVSQLPRRPEVRRQERAR